MYKKYLKRLIDIIFVVFGIIILSPFFVLFSVILYIDDPGNIIFTQKRFSIDKKIFNIYKFRTMKINTPNDVPTHLLKDPEKYITKVGSVLRKTSLDELPQLFNILIGQMSFVGPRPALYNQDDLIKERDKYGANGVMPGLTGWAQINGRDELSIAEKAKYDGEYVSKMSFLFDCKCILGTIKAVFLHIGVKEGGTGGY